MSESKKVLQIYMVETDSQVYLSVNPKNERYPSESNLTRFYFDDVRARFSFHPAWVLVSQEPKEISHLENQPRINPRYRLVDEAMTSDTFPLEMPQAEVQKKCSTDWKDEYAHLRSLYIFVADEVPPLKVIDEFEIIERMKVPGFTVPGEFKYPVAVETAWGGDHNTEIDEKSVLHQSFTAIIWPSLIQHLTPSRLTSHDTYKLVRQHILNHIDPKVAKITSDYDFCFEVKKRVPRTKPHKYQVDVNWGHNLVSKRKRQPKYETRISEERVLPCFKMTWSPKNYSGYPPIRCFEGDNQEDLQNQIEIYLTELMAIINEPLKECPTCAGVGVIMQETNP